VAMFDATRQPTMRRLNASTMKHTYAMPDRVGTYVRSVTHKASGRSAVKSRLTRSGARTASGSELVVNTFRRRDTPRMPSSRISRATWPQPMSWPARRAAFHNLWAP
jgi:hypothetical protein